VVKRFLLDKSSLLDYIIIMTIKTKEFFTSYAPDCRKRHLHKRDKNKLIEFSIQLEILVKDKWYPVIRYDTSHKFAHCDIIHWSGKKEKVAIPTLDFKMALSFADNDLIQNWNIYRERFLKEISYDKR